MYEYRCNILRVVDGDTVHADVDLGFDSHQLLTLRLSGINAPEMSTPEGRLAKEWLVGYLLRSNNVVTIRTIKDRREKYGRYLAELFGEDGFSINDEMVEAGHATVYPP